MCHGHAMWLVPIVIQSHTGSRILDILMLQDKTLFCTFENNKMASFGVDIYPPSASEHGQNIANITMINKKQLCRFIHMYIGKIFWPTAPCRGCPKKRDLGTGLGRVRFVFLTQTRLALLSSAQLFDIFFYRLG